MNKAIKLFESMVIFQQTMAKSFGDIVFCINMKASWVYDYKVRPSLYVEEARVQEKITVFGIKKYQRKILCHCLASSHSMQYQIFFKGMLSSLPLGVDKGEKIKPNMTKKARGTSRFLTRYNVEMIEHELWGHDLSQTLLKTVNAGE